jgi:citrate synthase
VINGNLRRLVVTQDAGFSKGLAGVVADETSVSQVQGEHGRLIYRGIPIEEIAEKSTFEETAFFLLKGKLPNQGELAKVTETLKSARGLPKHVETVIDAAPKSAHPMMVLQTAIGALAFEEGPSNLKDIEGNISKSMKLTSQLATAVARISRNRRGLAPLAPKPELNHAANFLYMMTGNVPNAEEARMFDVACLLHMDHDFNAYFRSARDRFH